MACTPSDIAKQPACRGFSCNVAGNITFRAIDDGADVVLAALAGVIYQSAIAYVRATGTTATGILLWQ